MRISVYIILLIILILGCSRKNRNNKSSADFNSISSSKSIIIAQKISLKNKRHVLNNKILVFENDGELSDGILICNNCELIAPPKKIFNNLDLNGTFNYSNGYLQWFLGHDFTNAVRNLTFLNVLIKNEFAIVLDRMVPIKCETDITISNPNRLIKIKGDHKEKCGLILETKHTNVFFHYFRSVTGFNLDLKNLTLTTRDYLNGIKPEKEAEYFLTGSYYQAQFNPDAKPNIDSITIKDCVINGNIAIAFYGSHSNNQSLSEFKSKNKINKLIIENTIFQYCNNPFSFSNMGYDSILISNNKVLNFSSAFISIPESGINESYYEDLRRQKKYVLLKNNIFENDKVVTVQSGRTLSPCVIKGGYSTMIFENNILKNLLSNSPDADVNTFYFTCENPGKCIVRNNNITNVLGRGSISYPASLIKQRSASYFLCENNVIILDKSALVSIGVLKNIRQEINTLDGNDFYCEFLQIGGQTAFDKTMILKNNIFKMPLVNKSTQIQDIAELIFENNTFEIDYFGPAKVKSTVSDDNVFFLGKQRYDRPTNQPLKDFIFKNNKFNIKSCGSKTLHFLHYPDGVQVGSVKDPDLNYNYANVIIDDKFQLNNTALSFTLPDGISQSFTPEILGKRNAFNLIDIANANHLRRNAQKLKSNVILDSAKWNTANSPFVLIPESDQVLRVNAHEGDTINVLNYIYFTSLYNSSKDENYLCYLTLNALSQQNEKIQQDYWFSINHQNSVIQLENERKELRELDSSTPTERPISLRNQSSSLNVDSKSVPKLLFIGGNKHLKEAKVLFTSCSNLKSYTLTFKVLNNGKNSRSLKEIKQELERVKIK